MRNTHVALCCKLPRMYCVASRYPVSNRVNMSDLFHERLPVSRTKAEFSSSHLCAHEYRWAMSIRSSTPSRRVRLEDYARARARNSIFARARNLAKQTRSPQRSLPIIYHASLSGKSGKIGAYVERMRDDYIDYYGGAAAKRASREII